MRSNYIQRLRIYSESVRTLKRRPVPDGFEAGVMDRLASAGQKNGGAFLRYFPVSKLRMAGIAAILMLFLILVIPRGWYLPVRIETDYTFFTEKKGKGPALGNAEQMESIRMDQLMNNIDRAGGRIVRDGFNDRTGCTDYLVVRLRRDSFPSFRERYNLHRNADTLRAWEFTGISKYVDIQVWFPGRRLVAGDFNGDGFADILAWYRQGRLAGRWYVCYNDRNGNFEKAIQVTLRDTLTWLPEESALLSADINGDYFSDLVLQVRIGKNEGKWYWYPNNREGGFSRGRNLRVEEHEVAFTGINVPLVADMNGDGLDDIGAHYRKGRLAGQWVFSLNQGNGQFGMPSAYAIDLPGTGGEHKYFPFLIDLNGDHLSDAGIYGQQGPLDAHWYISINRGNGRFDAGVPFWYAFMGEYYPFTGDFTGDGLDDILVKYGTPDESGQWVLYTINPSGPPALHSSPKFGGREDFTAGH